MTYRGSGVDLGKAEAVYKKIKPMARSTFRPEVLTEIGGFGAMFSLRTENCQRPVLVSAADGVGTKLKVAMMADLHKTIGIDLVAMCANDIVVQGAEPLFFLDYLAMGEVDLQMVTEIIEGICEGCRRAGCSLIGGETAELPGVYKKGEYDLAGFSLGVVEHDHIIDGSTISVGDQIIGLASSGLHSNGYSLARKIFFQKLKWDVDTYLPDCGKTLGQEMLEPTRIYVKTLLNLTRDFQIKGIVHITGGGLAFNIPRILPAGCQAVIRTGSWKVPPIFELIRKNGRISKNEMMRVFNNGIGMVFISPQHQVDDIFLRVKGLNEEAYLIGEIVKRNEHQAPIRFE